MVSKFEADEAPMGLNEEIVKFISSKNEPKWLLDWRLKSYRHWTQLEEPKWANVNYPKIDYQGIKYYSAPKKGGKVKSLNELDPEMIKTFERLGISLNEQKRLSGIAVDAVIDSVSVVPHLKTHCQNWELFFAHSAKPYKNIPN